MKTLKAFLKDLPLIVTYAAMFTGAWWLFLSTLAEKI